MKLTYFPDMKFDKVVKESNPSSLFHRYKSQVGIAGSFKAGWTNEANVNGRVAALAREKTYDVCTYITSLERFLFSVVEE
jgi:hypothetical protein